MDVLIHLGHSNYDPHSSYGILYYIELMSLFPEFERDIQNRLEEKKNLKIGIFGSFHETRKPFLDSLKAYLRDNSYTNIQDASDFPEESYSGPDDKYIHAFDNSRTLLNSSEVCICFIFFEKDGEHGINESLTVELSLLINSDQKSGIVLIIEKGAEQQIHANLKGIIAIGKKSEWRTIDLDPKHKIHEQTVESICYNYIEQKLRITE